MYQKQTSKRPIAGLSLGSSMTIYSNMFSVYLYSVAYIALAWAGFVSLSYRGEKSQSVKVHPDISDNSNKIVVAYNVSFIVSCLRRH